MAEIKIKISISIDSDDHEHATEIAKYLAKNKSTGKSSVSEYIGLLIKHDRVNPVTDALVKLLETQKGDADESDDTKG